MDDNSSNDRRYHGRQILASAGEDVPERFRQRHGRNRGFADSRQYLDNSRNMRFGRAVMDSRQEGFRNREARGRGESMSYRPYEEAGTVHQSRMRNFVDKDHRMAHGGSVQVPEQWVQGSHFHNQRVQPEVHEAGKSERFRQEASSSGTGNGDSEWPISNSWEEGGSILTSRPRNFVGDEDHRHRNFGGEDQRRRRNDRFPVQQQQWVPREADQGRQKEAVSSGPYELVHERESSWSSRYGGAEARGRNGANARQGLVEGRTRRSNNSGCNAMVAQQRRVFAHQTLGNSSRSIARGGMGPFEQCSDSIGEHLPSEDGPASSERVTNEQSSASTGGAELHDIRAPSLLTDNGDEGVSTSGKGVGQDSFVKTFPTFSSLEVLPVCEGGNKPSSLESKVAGSHIELQGGGHSYNRESISVVGIQPYQSEKTASLWRGKKSQVPHLSRELEEKLTRGKVECMICYEMVGRASPVWSCGSCYSIFHLSCIRKWARAPTSADTSVSTSNNSLEGNWRCPGCQTVELVVAKDLRYFCFCGQVENPPVDHFLTPHSCGGPCKKGLDKSMSKRCTHYCTLQCHPGPCPPCSAIAPPESCPCGKKTFTRRCGEARAINSCGQVCGKQLLCGRHSCTKICHEGACELCSHEVNVQCFCGSKKVVKACGQVEIQGKLDFGLGIFSCGSPCSKMLTCGNHVCRDGCHPGYCGECELSPSKMHRCPCGKKLLQELMGSSSPRIVCTDPVPTCGQACGKLLLCEKHVCPDLCHCGPCPPCTVPAQQKCRCGSSTRSVVCNVLHGASLNSESEDSEPFVCDKKCGLRKHCGKHQCSNRCCSGTPPAVQQADERVHDPHDCMLVCGKKLRCRRHNCEDRCHSGHCPPCLQSIFTELSCPCGRTFIPPPVPCGTSLPPCPHLCTVPQLCGHEATHPCHTGYCPPCTTPVAKECVGNHLVVRGVPCGSRNIKCNNICKKPRQCGLHTCERTCHVQPCDNTSADSDGSSGRTQKASCGQSCGAPRRDCSHKCVAPCHPSSNCPENRCKILVTITCACGRLSGQVPCEAGASEDSKVVADPGALYRLPAPLQPLPPGERIPLGQRKLACDDQCAKLDKRRILADAFGMDLPGEGHSGIVGSEALAEVWRKDPQWVLAVQDRFKALLVSPKGSTGCRVHVFCPMPKEKRDIIYQLAERWLLTVTSAGREPRRLLIIHATSKSKVPVFHMFPKMPAPVSGQVGSSLVFNPSLDLEPGLVVGFLDVPREVDVSSLVLRFAGECELVWLNDKNALAVFGDLARAATALKRVDHTSTYRGVSVPGVSSSRGAWGQTSVPTSKPSIKKKSVEASIWSEDGWGEDRKPSKEGTMGAWQGKSSPINTSRNPWGALEQGTEVNSPAMESSNTTTSNGLPLKEGHNEIVARRGFSVVNEQGSGVPNQVAASSSISNITLKTDHDADDDWEALVD